MRELHKLYTVTADMCMYENYILVIVCVRIRLKRYNYFHSETSDVLKLHSRISLHIRQTRRRRPTVNFIFVPKRVCKVLAIWC